MLKRTALFVAIASAALVGSAVATPIIGTITAETARGTIEDHFDVRTKFDIGGGVMLKTKGSVEVITQRIVADPGSSLGWHSHPGENFNVIAQGTITLFHDEACTEGTEYTVGDVFSTSPNDVHLAHNSGTEQLIFFATYFAPKTDPLQPVRVDQPFPAPGCPG